MRDAVDRVLPAASDRRTLLEAARAALCGRGRSRRAAERVLLHHPSLPPAALVPVVLAARDGLRREGRTPRGLPGRIDHLLCQIAITSHRRARTLARRVTRPLPTPTSIPERPGRVLRGLLALAPDAILTLRASGRVGVWSRAGVAITGRRRRDLVQAGVRALFTDPGEMDALLSELEERGTLDPHETRVVRFDGTEVPVRIHGARLAAPPAGVRPDPERHLLFLHDLTEVHRIRSRLIETEKLSAMAKIAGSVAHEFRNPLNSLFLSTDLLEDELAGSGAPEEAIAPTLTAIREEIERLNQIINHYLSLSKVASNAPEVVDMGRLVEEFAAQWADRASEQHIGLRVRCYEGDPAVSADPNQVRRVLVNLVENAFEALEDGRRREGEGSRPGRVTLLVRPMRRSVKLVVRDNGAGLPEEMRERVFEPFHTSKSHGSGLGLYLVREIVLAHGGAISLSSTGRRGTSVSMNWPRPGGETA